MTGIKNTQSKSWIVHVTLLGLRLGIAMLLLAAMPLADARWGDVYPGDGQRAFGIIIVFGMIGGVVAAAYVLIASTLHYLRRKKKWQQIALLDGCLGALLVAALFTAGITAKYQKEPNQPPEPTAPSGRGSA